MMGIFIILAMTAVYYIAKIYDSPEALALSEIIVVGIVFIVGNSIIREIEQMARLNKSKSEFVSIASHQLRTPLSAIQWETDLLLSKFGEGLNEKQRENIKNIDILSHRMAKLVGDLLDVAKIDQGNLILKKERIDLVKITKDLVAEIKPVAESRKIKVLFNSEKTNIEIIGDIERIELALENLISNAVKYTLEGGEVTINLSQQDDVALFSVKDSGVGIPINQQAQVFSKFFRSNNVLRMQTEGTGLGLYIAESIVNKSGGNIWFESKENSGTTFNISLPIKT
jgi:signal transduction histidine kinase